MNQLPVFGSGSTVHHAADPTARRLSAEDLPVLRSATTSKANLLSLIKPGHTGALDRVDVHEDILAIIRLDEPEALLVVEPLHGSLRHIVLLFSYVCNEAAQQRSCPTRGPEEINKSLSPEALTSAVMQRYHVYIACRRELGAKFGKFAASN